MPHEVIMPALGMSQDTGQLVAWYKQVGDAVTSSDALMDVETDKAVVQVEAGYDGFLVAIRAEAGDEVPVGKVVAYIGDSPDTEAPSKEISGDKADSGRLESPVIEQQVTTPHSTYIEETLVASPERSLGAAGERILASPKARRLAKERGIDLRQLVQQGLPQPFHVVDLDTVPGSAPESSATSRAMLRAAVNAAGFHEFFDWLSVRTDGAISAAITLAAFAAGSWRLALADELGDASIVVLLETPGGRCAGQTLVNPDQTRLMRLADQSTNEPPRLRVRDLTAGPLIAFDIPGGADVPTITVTQSDASSCLEISLDFRPDMLSADAGAGILTELARRLDQPLRHLL